MNQNHEVKSIVRTDLDDFLAELGQQSFDKDLDLRSFAVLDSDGKITAALAMSNIKSRSVQKLYTSEILGVWSSGALYPDLVIALLRAAQDSRPIDLFVNVSAEGVDPKAFSMAGFTPRIIDQDFSVFEWRNPKVSFYTYRISSTEDPGYYIGRKTIWKSEVSETECLSDGYMGSGGSLFRDWITFLNPDSIVKEILGIQTSWEDSLIAEDAAIGKLYSDDPHCKNLQSGGLSWANQSNWFSLKSCAVHGETAHNGNSCAKCSISKVFITGLCDVHGEALFRGAVCEKCSQAKRYSEGECPKHGLMKFRNAKCVGCIGDSAISLRKCVIHGFVTHQGGNCSTCHNRASISIQECKVHGQTKHQGDQCSTCNAEKAVSIKSCPVHGESKYSGDHCMKCNAEAQFSVKVCPIHGEVTFKGDTCAVCTANKSVSMKVCSIHGVTKHQGDVCNSCNAQKSISQKDCPKHGRTTHQGTVCNRCNAEASISEKECSKHGLSKFQGDKCVKCRNGSLISEKDCSVHGLSKHRGMTCMKCSQTNRRKPEDVLAEAGFVPADVSNAVAAGETLTAVAKRFGISKHHVKKFTAPE